MATRFLRHVLFPYDFSEQCRQTAPFVRTLAEKFEARITLFSAVPPAFESVPAEMGGTALRAGDSSADWRRALQRQLDQALVEEFAGLNVTRVADSGEPGFRIAAFVKRHDVDLVMMPTHGLGLFRSLVVGSVTSRVLRDSTCPIWTAPHAETQTAPHLPRTILCAVDSASSRAAVMCYAARFASCVGAALEIVHVVEPVSDILELQSERRLQRHASDAERDALATAALATGIAAPLQVVTGGIVEATAAEARRIGAELVVIGRGTIAEPFGRLRTHAFGIVQRSPCPVLSV